MVEQDLPTFFGEQEFPPFVKFFIYISFLLYFIECDLFFCPVFVDV